MRSPLALTQMNSHFYKVHVMLIWLMILEVSKTILIIIILREHPGSSSDISPQSSLPSQTYN